MTKPESPFSAIKERLEKITPGPWRVSDDPDDYGQQIKSAANLWVGATFGDEGEESGRTAQLDATFIAHAPSDIRTLLEAVEERDAIGASLMAERDQLQERFEAEERIVREQDAEIARLRGHLKHADQIGAPGSQTIECHCYDRGRCGHHLPLCAWALTCCTTPVTLKGSDSSEGGRG